MEEQKEFPKKTAKGAMQYELEFVYEGDDIRYSIRHEQSNENNLAAFHAVQCALKELFEDQKSANPVSAKMSKDELKQLQTAITVNSKFITSLVTFLGEKYKDVVPTADRKIQVIKPQMNVIPKIKM